MKRQSWLTAANGLTLLRAALVAPAAVAVGNAQAGAALALVAIAAATDVADGWLARRTGTATPLGAVLDPAADAMLVFALQIQLVAARQWPVYLLVVTAVSFLVFALRLTGAGRAAGGRAGKYVGAAVIGAIVLHLACRLLVPGQWDRVAAVVCPLVAIYVVISIFENFRAALVAPGGVYGRG